MRRFGTLAVLVLLLSGCGGGSPRSSNADLVAIRQPTPDPTLDAVVRDLPRALAGIVPTSTPIPPAKPAVLPVKLAQPQPTPTPTAKTRR